MSGVPSFFNGPATFTECALYRLSGVPSFLSAVIVFVLIIVVGLVQQLSWFWPRLHWL